MKRSAALLTFSMNTAILPYFFISVEVRTIYRLRLIDFFHEYSKI